jgi:hypothetical protein
VKFHFPSYALGVLTAVVVGEVADRVRPVVVETLALGSIAWRWGRGVVEEQRENVEDLWAEVRQQAHDKWQRGRANGKQPPPQTKEVPS